MLKSDLRFVFRCLWRRPGFALAAILTIALGVGANSAVFSVIYSVLLRPLPFRQPDRLVQLWETDPSLGETQISFVDYGDWRSGTKSFQQLAAYTFQAMNHVALTGQGEPEQIQGTMVSYDLFPMLGIQMLKGRSFGPSEEDQESRVVLLSEQLWKRKFSADPNIVGRAIQIGPLSFTVVGVVPQMQGFPQWADVWMPLSLAEPMLRTSRRFRPLEVVGRLKDGVSLAQARSEVASLATDLAHTYPETNRNRSARLVSLLDNTTGAIRPALLISLIAVVLVLLMACVNVANLLLIRTTTREREIAVRVALGTPPRQLIRLLALETVTMITIGSLLGAGVVVFAFPLLRRFAAARVPRIDGLHFEPVICLYMIGVILVLSLLTPLPSCFRVMRSDLSVVSRKNDVRTSTTGKGRLGSILMTSEVAMAFCSFAIALLLVHSFIRLMEIPTGFDDRNVVAVDVVLSQVREWDQAAKIFDTQLQPPLSNLPGITSVAQVNVAPMTLGPLEISRFSTRFAVPGSSTDAAHAQTAQLRWSSQDYFKALRIPLLRGELLRETDRNKNLYLINDALAKRYFGNQDPVGKQLLLNADTSSPIQGQIAGVVGDVHDLGLDIVVQPTIYQIDTSPVFTILLRTSGDPSSFMGRTHEVIRDSVPGATIGKMRTLDQLVHSSVARYRFALWLMISFAAISAFLSLIGVYGVIAFSVGRRTREFGIRAAFGASPSNLAALVLGESLQTTLVGLGVGLALTWGSSHAIRSMLFHTASSDPVALAVAAVLLVILSVGAMLLPAMRASDTTPAVVLRDE